MHRIIQRTVKNSNKRQLSTLTSRSTVGTARLAAVPRLTTNILKRQQPWKQFCLTMTHQRFYVGKCAYLLHVYTLVELNHFYAKADQEDKVAFE